jgi:antirestriction protein ArdC
MATAKVAEIVTERIIAALEKGNIPWKKTWSTNLPKNLVSKKDYRGMNVFILAACSSDEYFVTYKQAAALGGNVKKGEKGIPVIFWNFVEHENKETGKKKTVPFMRYYTVFGLSQCENLKAPEKTVKQNNPIENCEKVIANMPNKPNMKDGSNASYQPVTDTVTMPQINAFQNAESYYATLFHEEIHATGHNSRLNREGVAEHAAAFGSATYSKEELVAELGSAFLCAETGISSDNLIENSVAYVQSWIKALKNDAQFIISASSKARKAAEYILNKKDETATTTETAE